jgi:hypothetical protein
MVYIAGDNNLDMAGYRDIKEMEKVGSTDKYNLIVQYDRSKQFFKSENRWEVTKRYYIEKSDNPDTITSPEVGPALAETNTGDPKVLTDFVEWTIGNYPAENYFLIIGSHGTGWTDWPEYRASSAFKISIFNHPKLLLKRLPDKLDMVEEADLKRAIANDDSAKDFLDNIELRDALDNSKKKIGLKPFVVGFDACLMSALEVYYQNRNTTDFCISSEETEPGEGWPYDKILNLFLTAESLKAESIVKEVVNTTINYFNGKKRNDIQVAVTQAVIDMRYIDQLVKSVDELAQVCIGILNDDFYMKILKILKRDVQRFYDKNYIDLVHFVTLIKEAVNHGELSGKCDKVINDANTCIINGGHLSESVRNSHGISIYFPILALDESFRTIYKKLDICKDYPNWSNFLEKFHNF